jgi:hypothetical protein
MLMHSSWKSPTHPKDFIGRAAAIFRALLQGTEIMENEL